MNEQVMMGRCTALVIALVGKDTAPSWWKSPNKAFDMQSPCELWNTEPEKVYEYLMYYSQK